MNAEDLFRAQTNHRARLFTFGGFTPPLRAAGRPPAHELHRALLRAGATWVTYYEARALLAQLLETELDSDSVRGCSKRSETAQSTLLTGGQVSGLWAVG